MHACIIFLLIFVVGGEEIAICGSGSSQLLDGSSSFPFVTAKKDHVAVIPKENGQLSISLFDNDTNLVSPIRCSLRVETCSDCVLSVKFRSPSDYLAEKDVRMMASCQESSAEPCFELRFVEERADSAIDTVYKKTSIWEEPHLTSLNSSGDSIVLVVTLWNIDQNSSLSQYITDLFPFEIKAISNTEYIVGSPSENILLANQSSVGFIQSPRYPAAYPRTLSKMYKLINSNPHGYVRLIFDDFHAHFQSELQILDSDGTVLFNTKNDHRRPPAMISRASNLTVHFLSHDFAQIVGFRARYEFVEEHDWPERPNSRNCDEHLEGYGGEIKLEGNSQLVNSYVDCVWVIGRFPHMSRTFDRIYLKVEDFHLKGVGLRLEVREGASSTSDRLLLLFDSQTRDQLEHKQPRHGFATNLARPAYYVRLRGFLMSTSGLEIVYSQFYRWATALCPGMGEYHCDNARCIKATLRCDGINHCGDGSDEQCHRSITGSDMKPPDADISGLIALVVGVCGLVVLLISTTAVMTRIYRRRLSRQVAEVSTISGGPTFPSEMAPSIQTVGERRFYVVPENQISVIEAPPSYDDAMKHPAVPASNSYSNQAFSPGSSSDNLAQRAMSPEPPPVFIEDEQPSTSRNNLDVEQQPGTSREPEDDESWV